MLILVAKLAISLSYGCFKISCLHVTLRPTNRKSDLPQVSVIKDMYQKLEGTLTHLSQMLKNLMMTILLTTTTFLCLID